MPSIFLPLLPGAVPVIGGEAEQLSAFLAPLNDPFIAARIGNEQVIQSNGPWLTTQGDRFRTREGWTQGRRYLCLDRVSGQPIAALNVSLRAKGRKVTALASNVFVHPSRRRQGLASGLMRMAQEDFPGLCVDATLTRDGARLVGLDSDPPPPSLRPRKPR